ncbi:MAG: hypothetical protein JWR02_1542 [Mucilaginibacter sp.]|nr:hypothetical protein [Mucilaginibacter sp.]
MDLTEIKQKKMHGDYEVASQMVGITKDNARHALRRVDSKHHLAVCKALTMIITHRDKLINKG